MEPLSRLNAELSDEAHDAWRAFAHAHGVSVTALLEAVGLALREQVPPSDALEAVVESARLIDSERRERS